MERKKRTRYRLTVEPRLDGLVVVGTKPACERLVGRRISYGRITAQRQNGETTWRLTRWDGTRYRGRAIGVLNLRAEALRRVVGRARQRWIDRQWRAGTFHARRRLATRGARRVSKAAMIGFGLVAIGVGLGMFGVPLVSAWLAGQLTVAKVVYGGSLMLFLFAPGAVFLCAAASVELRNRSHEIDTTGITVERDEGSTRHWWRDLRAIAYGGIDSLRLVFADGSRVLVPRTFLRPVLRLVRNQYLPGLAGPQSNRALFVKLTLFQLALGLLMFVLPAFLVPGTPRRWAPMIAGVLFLTAMPWMIVGMNAGLYHIGLMRYRHGRARERGRRTARLTSGE